MRFAAWFSLVVGILMIGQWAFFLLAGQVPELQAEPIAFAFHLAAESVTAAALIASGVLVLRGSPVGPGLGLIATGLLLYTVIVSPGYFAQHGDWSLVVMFGVLFALSLVSAVQLLRGSRATPVGRGR